MDSSKELQQIFFNIIATVSKFNQKDNVLKYILEKMCKYLEADYMALYLHYEKSPAFHLVDTVMKEDTFVPVRNVLRINSNKPEHFLKNHLKGMSAQTIPIHLPSNEELMLLIVKESPLTHIEVSTLKEESMKLFSIINEIHKRAQRNKENKFLLDVSTRLLRSNDKGIVLQEIVQALEQIYPKFPYYLILTQEYEETKNLPIKIMEYADENSLHTSTQVFMNGELQIDVRKDKSKKFIYAPLIGEQSVYGVLELITPIQIYFTEEELAFISEFAILAGKALEKTTLYEDSLMQVNNLTLLNDVIHDLNSSRELPEITKTVREKVIAIANASQVGFVYYNEDTDKEFEVLPGSTSLFNNRVGRDIARKVMEIIINEPKPIFSGNFTEINQLDYYSIMVFPMVHSGLNMGFIIVLAEDRYHFTFEDFKLIKTLIQHSSLAISNTILKERLQTTVITDFLTKLYTRQYLEDKMEEHMEVGKIGVLLLYDIDNFKCINDEHGHHVGDKVLKQVASVINEEVGNKGIAARWGGEELAIYLPEMKAGEGNKIADTIRQSVTNRTNPPITISCGISAWYKGYNDSPEELFLQADEALYKAKSSGKNQVYAHI